MTMMTMMMVAIVIMTMMMIFSESPSHHNVERSSSRMTHPVTACTRPHRQRRVSKSITTAIVATKAPFCRTHQTPNRIRNSKHSRVCMDFWCNIETMQKSAMPRRLSRSPTTTIITETWLMVMLKRAARQQRDGDRQLSIRACVWQAPKLSRSKGERQRQR